MAGIWQECWRVLSHYFSELLTSLLVLVTVWVLRLHALEPTCPPGPQMVVGCVFMVIGMVVMFNLAQTRVATERLVDLAEAAKVAEVAADD